MTTPEQTSAAALWSAAQSLMGKGDRPEQTRLFLRALTNGRFTAMQGPTGVGKSMYAVPLLLGTNGGRVIYSCATKSQQRQVYHDIGGGLTDVGMGPASLLFGRNEYLCLRRAELNRVQVAIELLRLARENHRPAPLRPGEPWEPPRLIGDGSRSFYPELADVWWLVNSNADEGCDAETCQDDFDYPIDAHTIAKRASRRARLLVINHHVLTIAEGHAVPPYMPQVGENDRVAYREAVIVDEAHELPDILASVYGAEITPRRLTRAGNVVLDVGQVTTDGWWDLVKKWERVTLPVSDFEEPFTGQAVAKKLADDTEWMIRQILETVGKLKSDYDYPRSTTKKKKIAELKTTAKMLSRLHGDLRRMDQQVTGYAQWIEKTGPKAKTGKAVAKPLNVRPYADMLFTRHRSVTVMSATLAGFPADRLGVNDKVLIGRSPFNLEQNRLGYVSGRSVDNEGWKAVQANWPDDEAVNELTDLIKAAGGRTLILATSHLSKERCRDRLLNRGIKVTAQGKSTATVPGVVEQLRDGRIDALVGVDSLATGIDIPGDALSLVVWLAWPNPETRTIFGKAVNEQVYNGVTRDAWDKYWGPAAKLKAEQGVGRLIRTPEDRGVVALLDPRRRFKRLFAGMIAPSRTIPSIGAVRHHYAAALV